MNIGTSVIIRSHGVDHEGIVTASTRSRVTVEYEDSGGDVRAVTVAAERVRLAGDEQATVDHG